MVWYRIVLVYHVNTQYLIESQGTLMPGTLMPGTLQRV